MKLSDDELLAMADAAKNDSEAAGDKDRGDAVDDPGAGDAANVGNGDAAKDDAGIAGDAADAGKDDAGKDAADKGDGAAADDDKSRSQNMIPRARLNEARAKQKEAEARAAELERKLEEMSKGAPGNKEFEKFTARVDELYEKVEVARAEGDYKEAAKLQRELDTMRDSASRASAQYISQQAALRAQQDAAYNAAVDQLELLVPEVNPRSDGFDQDVMDEIKDMTEAFEQRGKDSVQALRLAAKAVLGRDPFAEKKALRQTTPAPKNTDVAKNVAAANKTPPDVASRSVEKDQAAIDVEKLTDDEYAKLPKAVRERLRGDFA